MMFILKYSLACALTAPLLFITGTSAQDDTVIGFNLPQDSARASVDRSPRAVQKVCLSEADRKHCDEQIHAKYPIYARALPSDKSTAEVYCVGLVWWHKCLTRAICKKCSSKRADSAVASNTAKVKTVFTIGKCMRFKPVGELKVSCSSDIRSFTIPGGYTWSGGFGEDSAGTFAGTSADDSVAGTSADNSADNSADDNSVADNSAENFSETPFHKSVQMLAKVAGALVVFGLIGGLAFFFVFKKKGSGNNKVATGASTSSSKKKKKAASSSSKTGKSTVKSSSASKIKSSPGSAVKSAVGTVSSAKSSKSTTA